MRETFRNIFLPLWDVNPVLAVLQLLLPVLGVIVLVVYPFVGLSCIVTAVIIFIVWATPVWLTPRRAPTMHSAD